MEEIIVTGYCRTLDANRILCCETDGDGIEFDCLYGRCEFEKSCVLVKTAMEKLDK